MNCPYFLIHCKSCPPRAQLSSFPIRAITRLVDCIIICCTCNYKISRSLWSHTDGTADRHEWREVRRRTNAFTCFSRHRDETTPYFLTPGILLRLTLSLFGWRGATFKSTTRCKDSYTSFCPRLCRCGIMASPRTILRLISLRKQ